MKTEKMRVLLVEPYKRPKLVEIDHTLEIMQGLVGGTIQALYPWTDEVALICNDEGKLDGSLPNRSLEDDNGNIYDIVFGTFFICGLTEDNFGSLSLDLADKYADMFREPETYYRTEDNHIASFTFHRGLRIVC